MVKSSCPGCPVNDLCHLAFFCLSHPMCLTLRRALGVQLCLTDQQSPRRSPEPCQGLRAPAPRASPSPDPDPLPTAVRLGPTSGGVSGGNDSRAPGLTARSVSLWNCGVEVSGQGPRLSAGPGPLTRLCCHVAAGAYALQPPGWRKAQRCCRFRRHGGRAGRTETQPRGSPSRREAAELCSVPAVDSASRRDSEWAPPPCPPPPAPPGTPSRHVTAPLSTRPCGQRRASRAGSPCSSEVTAEIRPSEGGSASSSGSWRLIADRARVENQKAHFTKHFDTPRASVEPPRRGTERLGEAPEGLVPQLLCSPPVKPKRFLGLFGKILTFQAKRRPLGHKLRSVT